MTDVIPPDLIEHVILTIRGQRVMLDADLAALYEVETYALNRAVRRNIDRFPEDFMFELSAEEFPALTCQSGMSNQRGGRRHPPLAFTEQGVAMLSSVLRSDRAVKVNIEIMRAFVRMRRLMALEAEIRQRFEAIEGKDREQDAWIAHMYGMFEQLMAPPESGTKAIGFRAEP